MVMGIVGILRRREMRVVEGDCGGDDKEVDGRVSMEQGGNEEKEKKKRFNGKEGSARTALTLNNGGRKGGREGKGS